MLIGLAILFLIIWIIGLALHILGGIIYAFLVIGLILLIAGMFRRPR